MTNGTDIGTLFVKKNTVASAGPELFTATSFPGLEMWFDAYNITAVTKDTNNKVSSFNDKSGNNRNMIQPTAEYQPTISATAVNGKPGVSFTNILNQTVNYLYGDSNAQAFQLTSPTNNINKSIAIFGVSSGIGNKIGRSGLFNTNNIIGLQNNSTTAVYGISHGSSINYITVSTTDSSYRLESYISNRSNGTSSVKKNGVLIASKTYTPENINNTDSFGNRDYEENDYNFLIGTATNRPNPTISTVNSFFLNGTISEILVYTSDTGSEFTEDFRNKIDGYLAWKWGLTGNLPADHPYKNVASYSYSNFANRRSGLSYKTYSNDFINGYNAQSGNSQRYSYFDTATVLYSGIWNKFVLGQIPNMNNALKIYGYFLPNLTGIWKFSILADDIATFWFGSSTINPISSNYQLYSHFTSGTVNYSISLTEGIYYPLLLLYGQSGGGISFIFSFTDPLNVTRTDGTGYYFD